MMGYMHLLDHHDGRYWLNDTAREMLDTLDDIRVRGSIDRVRALLPDARAEGCGIRLVTVNGWFQSAEVADDVPVNTVEVVQRP